MCVDMYVRQVAERPSGEDQLLFRLKGELGGEEEDLDRHPQVEIKELPRRLTACFLHYFRTYIHTYISTFL